MKRLIILVSLLLCVSISAQAQADPFEKLMDMKGVTTVYISKAMLGMMSNMDSSSLPVAEGVDIGEVVKKLTSITVLTAEQPEAIKAIKQLASDIRSSKAYEQLMFAKNDEAKASIYAKTLGGQESEMVMIVDEAAAGKECVLIRFTGTMTLADIQKITAEKK